MEDDGQLSETQLDHLLADIRKSISLKNEYESVSLDGIDQTLNVLLVGRSRSGKSTAIEMIRDPTYVAGSMSIYAQTKQPKLHIINIKDKSIFFCRFCFHNRFIYDISCPCISKNIFV